MLVFSLRIKLQEPILFSNAMLETPPLALGLNSFCPLTLFGYLSYKAQWEGKVKIEPINAIKAIIPVLGKKLTATPLYKVT